MNFIHKLKKNSLNNYYDSIYFSFLDNIENENIIILNQNDYNPLNKFNNYFQKYNTNLYIFYKNDISLSYFNDEFDELDKFIKFDVINYESITNCILNCQKENKINKIIIMHIESFQNLENIIKISSYFKINLYIYVSLIINNGYKIYLKNELRNIVKYFNNESTNIGKVFDYDEFLKYLNNIDSSKIIKIDLVQDNHFISYGKSKLYLFIL